MDALPIYIGRPSGSVVQRLIAPTLGASLWLAALVLAARRLAGGLETPLSPVALGAVVLMGGLVAFGARVPSRSALVWWHPSAALLISVTVLSVPGTSPLGLIVAYTIVAVEEYAAWRKWRGGGSRITAPPIQRLSADIRAIQPLPHEAAVVDSLAADVVQQLTRTQSADGTDRLSGWLQAILEAGQRTVSPSFCPCSLPLPQVVLRQNSGPSVRIKAVQVLTHGVRLEIKLNYTSRQQERFVFVFSEEIPATAGPP